MMKQCPNCDFANPYDATLCGNCGFKLGNTTLLTRHIPRKTGLLTPISADDMHDNLQEIIQGANRESVVLDESEMLRFEVEGSDQPVVVPIRDELLLGRRDPTSPVQPDVNLTPYSGYRMGVSRRHAMITRSADGQLALVDLGSSNGTYLNERKLEVRRPYPLQIGDRISLGQMVLTVYLHQKG